MKHDVDLTGATWSNGRSGGTGNCVEVAIELPNAPGFVAVRDSKNPAGPALVFTDLEWATHVDSILAGMHHKG